MPYARPRLTSLLAGIIPFTLALALAWSAPPPPLPPPPAPVQPSPSQTKIANTDTAPIATLKATAQLVVVDVVVTDSKQMPVHNLKAADFTVLENGLQQQVTGFVEHVAIPPSQAAKVPPMPALPPGIFTNYTPVPPGTAVNVLLLDALNTQMKDQSYVREQLRQYLETTPAGTRIAIFGLNSHLIMLQGFTSDLTLLKAVAQRSGMSSSGVLANSGDAVGNGDTSAPSSAMSAASGPDMAQVVASMRKFEAVQAVDDVQLRLKTTLNALNQLANFLAGVPGRKNLVWFAGSYPEIFGSRTAQSQAEYRETTNLLARSRIAVYPVGAHGLATTATPVSQDASPTGRGLARAQGQFAVEIGTQNSAMNQIAADTGGQAYLDTNGLSEAAGKAIENGSNYYTLSYTPTDARQNGEFHKIQVKLAQQGLALSYRNGYYAEFKPNPSGIQIHLDSVAHAQGSDIPGGPSDQHTPLTRTMMHGAPNATDVLLKLQVLPASQSVETTVATGNIVSHDPATKSETKGPFRRYAVDIAADARDIRITPTPDGHYKFFAEVLAFVYGADGAVINTAALKAHGNLSPSSYANMMHVGIPFHLEISVPVNGEYYLRTSVQDVETGRFGAVEVPVASVAKLAPLNPAPARAVPTLSAPPR